MSNMQQTYPKKELAPRARGPLQGLKIIDLSRLVAGNMLTLQLADFGADVIKIEPRNGDTLRGFQSGNVESFWKVYARNKRSICIDFRHPEAQAILKDLIRSADAMVESFRPGVLEEMGLAPQLLHEMNPKLVVVRVSGWGQSGPFRSRPGFGTLVEGYAGFAAMNGFDDREPVLPPIFLGDMAAGLYGVGATMMAFWEVRNGGAGQVIDLSLFEPMLSIQGPQAAAYRITGSVKARTGSRSSTTAPRNVYRTSDGQWVCVSTSTATMARRLFATMGRDDMNTDPRYSTTAARLERVQEVDDIVSAYIGARTLEENLQIFSAAEVTIGPVRDAAALVTDRYIHEREAIVEVEDPELGSIPMHNIVPRLSATPGQFRCRAPFKGEHTRECLLPLLGQTRFDALIRAGAILDGARPPGHDESNQQSAMSV